MPANPGQSKKRVNGQKIVKLEKSQVDTKKLIEDYEPDELVFALDIGTRTVVGIVGVPEKDTFKVLAAEVVEHRNRAMLDGQIHDIAQVADVARDVKERIEKTIGIPLTKVAIAAAGRVLRTCQIRVDRDIEQGKEIAQDVVASIEMEAIQLAQLKLDEEISREDKTQFYCVGYSVINYYLNGYVISSLLGHRGRTIGADILATFLPHMVVDSLYTVMNRIGLEVISLTLEPIAAINVTIPKDLRLLNLALVDIGAGTSDIALTRDGSVVAYAMAPIAGDEITEKIAQHYLVDFNTAEKIKISLSTKSENTSFIDILGKKNTVKTAEVRSIIKPTVEFLGVTIAQKILEYNSKPPNAVFLIGGGSQVPGLPQIIAEHLKLPVERVVVRGRDVIQNVKYTGRKLSGPESITPFGIAVTAQLQKGQDFLSVTVNGKKIRLFNSKKLAVADALILVGFNPGQLIGRSGKSITFTLNGEKKYVRGELGRPSEIFINDKPASLETVLAAGDSIMVIPAEDGKDARVKIGDYVKGPSTGKVILNGSHVDIASKAYINGKESDFDTEIASGDVLEILEIASISDLARACEIDIDEFSFIVNDVPVDGSYLLHNMDSVQCFWKAGVTEVQTAAAYAAEDIQDIAIEEKIEVPGNDFPILQANSKNGVLVTVNGNPILLNSEKANYIFVDIFNHINFDLSKPQGNIVLRLNGRQAAFTDKINAGDTIEIFWEK